MLPALGVLLFPDYRIAELVELGQLSESLGYRYFWYADGRFLPECYLGLAAVAQNTREILLGPGVTDPYSRHPAITAASIATFDEIANGRALLGLGVGATGFRELGLTATLPVAALRETVEVVRGLLRGEEVTLEGKVVTIRGGKFAFKPVRDRIPIYFATHGAQVTRLAGRIADGVLIANTLNPSAFALYVDRLHAALEQEGRSPESFDIGLRLEACISDDEEAAQRVMRRRVAGRIIAQYPHWDYLDELGIRLPERFKEIAISRDKSLLEEAATILPRDVLESMVLAGRPERVAEQVARALHPAITQLTIRPHSAGAGVGPVIRSFMLDVMPRVAQILGSSSRRA